MASIASMWYALLGSLLIIGAVAQDYSMYANHSVICQLSEHSTLAPTTLSLVLVVFQDPLPQMSPVGVLLVSDAHS